MTNDLTTWYVVKLKDITLYTDSKTEILLYKKHYRCRKDAFNNITIRQYDARIRQIYLKKTAELQTVLPAC
jgi:hypothetical protein